MHTSLIFTGIHSAVYIPVYIPRFGLFFFQKWSFFGLFFYEIVVFFWSLFCDFVVFLLIGNTVSGSPILINCRLGNSSIVRPIRATIKPLSSGQVMTYGVRY